MTFVATCAVEIRDRVCDGPTQNFLCDSHRDDLVGMLWEIGGLKMGDRGDYLPSLLDELDITICGDDKVGGASIGIVVQSSETPLVFNERASEAKTYLCNSIVGWTRVFAEENPHLVFDVATIEDAARWMAGFPNLLAGHHAAVEMYQEIEQRVRDARRSIDRPVNRVYAGTCGYNDPESGEECTAPLLAIEGKPEVRCGTCGSTYNVEARHREIEARLRPVRRPARLIADALKLAGVGINVKTIRTWGNRGLLENYAQQGETPVHEIGEVLDLARRLQTRVSSCEEAA